MVTRGRSSNVRTHRVEAFSWHAMGRAACLTGEKATPTLARARMSGRKSAPSENKSDPFLVQISKEGHAKSRNSFRELEQLHHGAPRLNEVRNGQGFPDSMTSNRSPTGALNAFHPRI